MLVMYLHVNIGLLVYMNLLLPLYILNEIHSSHDCIFLWCVFQILISNTLRKQVLTSPEEEMCNVSAKKVEDIKLILFSNLLLNVTKMEESSHYAVKDYSNESNERNDNSCNCLHWALDSSILQNFPHE